MIPAIMASRGRRAGTADELPARLAKATREASAIIGLSGAVGALGGFAIPLTFGAPWVHDPAMSCKAAFAVFAGFYLICLVVPWLRYLRHHRRATETV
jgi:NNP family nitrate/nitrite transporter-like MFS transporter